MAIISLAQIQMAFNVSALPVSISGIVDAFDTSPTSVSTALVVYSLAVAGFVMLGAKIGDWLGSRRVFQAGVLIHGIAMGAMALSTSATMMIVFQGLSGLAAALLVPALVVMIATHYSGKQQSQSLGILGAAQATASVAAFLIVGVVSSVASWRIPFGLLVILAAILFVLSFRLKSIDPKPDIRIDWVGVLLAASSITLISLGFNYLNQWGFLLATPSAPFNIFGGSPAPLMIVTGILLAQGFFFWTRFRVRQGKSPLLSLDVLDSPIQRAGTYSLLVISALGPAINFLIPLYIQIVQGLSGLQTAVAAIPYSLAILIGTGFSVRLYDLLSPRQIGRFGFVTVAVGLVLLANSIQNEWGTPMVVLSLILIGLAEGSLLTLVFAVLVNWTPKALAGHVGALRGTTNNLATALGTAIASAFAVGVLTTLVHSSLVHNPTIPPSLQQEVSLDNVNFISNDQLLTVLEDTTANGEQVAEALRILTETRLQALKLSFLMLAGVALLAIYPAGWLPDSYAGAFSDRKPGDVPDENTAEPAG